MLFSLNNAPILFNGTRQKYISISYKPEFGIVSIRKNLSENYGCCIIDL